MIELVSVDHLVDPAPPPTAHDLLAAAGHLEDLLGAFPVELRDERLGLLAVIAAHLSDVTDGLLILAGELGPHHEDWESVRADLRETVEPSPLLQVVTHG